MTFWLDNPHGDGGVYTLDWHCPLGASVPKPINPCRLHQELAIVVSWRYMCCLTFDNLVFLKKPLLWLFKFLGICKRSFSNFESLKKFQEKVGQAFFTHQEVLLINLSKFLGTLRIEAGAAG